MTRATTVSLGIVLLLGAFAANITVVRAESVVWTSP